MYTVKFISAIRNYLAFRKMKLTRGYHIKKSTSERLKLLFCLWWVFLDTTDKKSNIHLYLIKLHII